MSYSHLCLDHHRAYQRERYQKRREAELALQKVHEEEAFRSQVEEMEHVEDLRLQRMYGGPPSVDPLETEEPVGPGV